MVNTRSSNKKQEETMATLSNEMKCYFEKLIEPLVTNKLLDLFSKLKGDCTDNCSWTIIKSVIVKFGS